MPALPLLWKGVSRSLLAQITRHRLASFSVQSQRYVKESNFSFVTPPEIGADPEANEIFVTSMERAVADYNALADRLQARHLQSFLEDGLPEKQAKRKAERRPLRTRVCAAQRLRHQNDFDHERQKPDELLQAALLQPGPMGD